MKKFSDVAREQGTMIGSKLKIDDVLNKTFQLTGFKVTKSHFHDECLTIQLKIEEKVQTNSSTEIKWIEHVLFTGSKQLINQLKDVEIDAADPPFCKIIKQELSGNRCFYKIVDPD